ncbi:MAG: hypothetical protein V3V33_16835 [Candidatus Lokiarchaeia archaeon]
MSQNNFFDEREIRFIFDIFLKKFKMNYSEFIESEDNLQKKEYIIREFYSILSNEYDKLKEQKKIFLNISNFLDEFKILIEDSVNIYTDYLKLSEKWKVYSKIPSNLEKVFQIFRLISGKSTYYRYFHILRTFYVNGDKYITRKELEGKISHILGNSIKNVQHDLRNLRINGLIKRSGLTYHLTKLGTNFFNSILRLEKDLQPDLMDQISRAILIHSVYEDEGLDIKSYRQVQQLGFLIKEIIQEWIEREEILDWIVYLDKFDQIIKDLDHFTNKYEDDPKIQQILLKTKSEISFEFSRYHKVAIYLLKQNLSLIDRGFYPKRIKECLNLFNLSNWVQLENIFKYEALETTLTQDEFNYIEIIENQVHNDNNDILIDSNDSIETEIINVSDAIQVLEKIIPNFRIFGRRLLLLYKKRNYLSEILNFWNLKWTPAALFIGNLPTIVNKYPVFCLPIKKSIKMDEYLIKESIICSTSKGEEK